jgi:hypothetical protein
MPASQNSTGNLVDKIQGIWARTGDETASFVIREGKIMYPEIDAAYNYYVSNDSIKIQYSENEHVFALHMQGADTLILNGHEKWIYFRYKE